MEDREHDLQPLHQNSTSQSHPFDNFSIKNRHIENPMLKTHDFFSARNLNQYQNSGLSPVEASTGFEDIEASLRRIHLSNPINNARSIGIEPESYDFGACFAMDSGSSYLSHEQQQSQLQRMRMDAAVRGLLGARERPNQDFLRNKSLQGLPNNDPFCSDSSALPQHQFRSIQNGTGRNWSDEFNRRNPSRTYTPGFRHSHNRNGSDDRYRQMALEGLKMEYLKFLSSPADDEQLLWTLKNFSSMQDVRGKVVLAAKDYRGSHFLQNKVDEGNPEDIDLIFWEVKDHLHELMTDHCGNYVIQKMFEAGNVHQISTLVPLVIQNEQKLMDACIDTNGCRAIQKLLEHLKTPEQITVVVIALKRITGTLAKDLNGGYVIQQCLKLFSPALTKLILDVVADNCVDISTNRCGCSIIQKCLGYATGEAMRRLVREIITHALLLSEDPYGNYVVQYVVKMRIPAINTEIIVKLCGKYSQLSKNKHGSNVVEDLLKFSEENQAGLIILEIMSSHNFLSVVQDPFGNYVVQTALKYSKGDTHLALSKRILDHYAYLHSHLYGKRVLDVAKGCRHHVCL